MQRSSLKPRQLDAWKRKRAINRYAHSGDSWMVNVYIRCDATSLDTEDGELRSVGKMMVPMDFTFYRNLAVRSC